MNNRADQRKFHYVYKIIREDGAYYIGLHSTDDLNDGYFGSGQRLWHSIKKHGKEKHSKEILEFLPSRKEAKDREFQLVNAQTLKDPWCLNLRVGGSASNVTLFGRPQSEEHKQKVSNALRGKKKPEGFGDKVKAALTGRKMTEEQRKKMSLAKTGKHFPRLIEKRKVMVNEVNLGVKK